MRSLRTIWLGCLLLLPAGGCDDPDNSTTTEGGADGASGTRGTDGADGADGSEEGGLTDEAVTGACEAVCEHIASCHPAPGPDDGEDDGDSEPYLEWCLESCAWIDEVYMPTQECQAARLAELECKLATTCEEFAVDDDTNCKAERDARGLACPNLE